MERLVVVFVRGVFFLYDLYDMIWPPSLGEKTVGLQGNLSSRETKSFHVPAYSHSCGAGLDTSTNFTCAYLYYFIHILSTRRVFTWYIGTSSRQDYTEKPDFSRR